ncbi:MAG: polyprenyl synthetase family protein [Candidatus Zixiibacteriota bacterium]
MPALTSIDGRRYCTVARELTDRLLDRFLPSSDTEPRTLHEAMRYSVMAGGKRLRPILALAAYEYCGGNHERAPATVHKAMAALEMVHTYSLIHDDLPCMDDDDLRRGRPTCHKKFSEAVATLAGDALHVVAFELMAQTGSTEVVVELARSGGTAGMLGGQMADIEAEGRRVDRKEIERIHRLKTAALIRGSVRIGAMLAGAERSLLERLSVYGEKVGLAFQIIDDILDIEGDQELLGKEVGSDSRNAKATYPGVVGMEASRRDAARLVDEALACFEPDEDNILMWLARYIGQRNN